MKRRDFIKSAGLAITGASMLVNSFGGVSYAFDGLTRKEADAVRDPITLLSAIELSKAIKNRKYSCVEVMTAYLNKIDVLNPKVNAIVSMVDRTELLKQASDYDKKLIAGEYIGWMHGFPIAIKDLSGTKDIPTTYGSILFKTFEPEYNNLMVDRVLEAGAIIIGKTNVPEFGLGSHTYNNVFGTTLNAYDQSKSAGGSSGGAAVTMALKMLPVVDGSDMMGSLRNPAAFNNVIGFRPSQGLVPGLPSKDIFTGQMAYEGAMGRNVRDTAALFATQAGRDERAPLSMHFDKNLFFKEFNKSSQNLKIGWISDFVGELEFEPGILELCNKGLQTLSSMGHTVEDVNLGVSRDLMWSTWVTLRNWLVAGRFGEHYENKKVRSILKPELIWEIESGLKLSALDVNKAATDNRTSIYNAFYEIYKEYDILVLPSAQVFPFNATDNYPKKINEVEMDTYHRWMEVVAPVTLAGLPSLNVPVGFNKKGLPMGMQLIGPHLKDAKVLRLGKEYEDTTQWNIKYLPELIS